MHIEIQLTTIIYSVYILLLFNRYLDFRKLLEVFLKSSILSLSRLQIFILLTASRIQPDGKVDYYDLVPIIAHSFQLLRVRLH